jgi:hypothetical protein
MLIHLAALVAAAALQTPPVAAQPLVDSTKETSHLPPPDHEDVRNRAARRARTAREAASRDSPTIQFGTSDALRLLSGV